MVDKATIRYNGTINNLFKDEFLSHIKSREIEITDVHELVSELKDYGIRQKIKIGVSFTSFGTHVRCLINLASGTSHRFIIELKEVMIKQK